MDVILTHIKNYKELITFVALVGGYLFKGKTILSEWRDANETRKLLVEQNNESIELLEKDILEIRETLVHQAASNKAVLHDKIYKYCTQFLHEEEVGVEDLHNLEMLFISYKKLGGNGTAEALYKKVLALEIKK